VREPTTNPVLTGLEAYFTDAPARARAREPDADWIDLSIGDPLEETPAFVREALIDAVGPVSQYPTSAGRPELRAAVAGWARRRHGVAVDPDRQVLPSAGSKEAIFHLPLALVDAHGSRRHVLWGDPGYPVYARGALFAGGVSDPVTLEHQHGWRLDLASLAPERLERACLAWLNYPHNPTGATVDVGYLREQVAVAREHGIVLASDECYQEIWFDRPAPSVLEACGDDTSGVLAFVSLSKRSGMTGYRSGAIIGDPDLVALLRRLRPNLGTASPTFVQAAATAAWSDQAHVEDRRRGFAAKREVLRAFLDEAGIEVLDSDGTFYLWCRAPGGDDLAYAQALLAAHVIVTPGRVFGPAGAGWFRIALVPTLDGCVRAVAAWRGAIDAGIVPR
jgi:succinyldiaminopimelate transaminase